MNASPLTRRLAGPLMLLLLSGCAGTLSPAGTSPGTTPAAMPAAAPDDTARLRERLEQTDARLQRLQDSVVMLEVRVLDQQRLVESLRQQLGGGSVPAGDSAALAQKSPAELYLAAFGDYTSGRYRQAIEGFTAFLRYYPANDYAPNARYLLGEALLAQGDYPKAAAEFTRLLKEFPHSEKAPEALLKLAAAQHALGQPDQAAATLQKLRDQYPDSAAARKAAAAAP